MMMMSLAKFLDLKQRKYSCHQDVKDTSELYIMCWSLNIIRTMKYKGKVDPNM